jgi:hypothetical protein
VLCRVTEARGWGRSDRATRVLRSCEEQAALFGASSAPNTDKRFNRKRIRPSCDHDAVPSRVPGSCGPLRSTSARVWGATPEPVGASTDVARGWINTILGGWALPSTTSPAPTSEETDGGREERRGTTSGAGDPDLRPAQRPTLLRPFTSGVDPGNLVIVIRRWRDAHAVCYAKRRCSNVQGSVYA